MSPPQECDSRPSCHTGPAQSPETLDAFSIALIASTAREIGWNACLEALFESGQDLAREAAATSWRHPRFVELEARRTPDWRPCPAKCDRCSRCVASRAYWSRGGRMFEGIAADPVTPW